MTPSLRHMRLCAALSLLGIAQSAWPAPTAQPPSPADFTTHDGAYFTTIGGHVVDPYFINKSFIVALEANAPVRAEFERWLQWLLPRQRPDGGFDRYCMDSSNQWKSCMKADADDSTAATTMQLLAMANKKGWIPAAQKLSVARASRNARRLLTSLLNPKTAMYQVFADTEQYYLMDNAEVYEGLRAVGETAAANALASAMRRQFFTGTDWKPAIPEYKEVQFYPHSLAHAYIWGTSILPSNESSGAMARWLAANGNTWLQRSGDQYAWGLVAWELRTYAPAYAACWRASLRPFQASIGWTVLDAFVDQSLQHLGIGTQCALAPVPAATQP
jgi:hypothetical protein